MENKFTRNDNRLIRPLGIFDSGLGGLSVIQNFIDFLPNQPIIYLADTANLPYGSKSLDTVRNLVKNNIEFLVNQNVQAILMACGTAGVLHATLPFDCPVSLFTITDQLVKQAINITKNGRIAVLGTKITSDSGIYKSKISKVVPNLKVIEIDCQEFVNIVENRDINSDFALEIVANKLEPAIQMKCDTIVLACTHFPWLKNQISKVISANIVQTDNNFVRQIQKSLMTNSSSNSKIQFFINGSVENFESKTNNLLKVDFSKITFQKAF